VTSAWSIRATFSSSSTSAAAVISCTTVRDSGEPEASLGLFHDVSG
jgi:hypothetical protein